MNESDRFAWIREDRGEDDPDFVDHYLEYKNRVKSITTTCTWIGAAIGIVIVIAMLVIIPFKELLKSNPVRLLVFPFVTSVAGYLMSIGVMLVMAPNKVFDSPEGRQVLRTIGTTKKSVGRALILVCVILGFGLIFLLGWAGYKIYTQM